MTNKINGISAGTLQPATAKTSHQDTSSRGSDGARQTPVRENTTVNITQNAQFLGKLDQTLAAIPIVDQARVDSIKEAIANGQYEINAGKIADALLKFDRELGDA